MKRSRTILLILIVVWITVCIVGIFLLYNFLKDWDWNFFVVG